MHEDSPAPETTLDTERGLRHTAGRQALYSNLLRLFAEHHGNTLGVLQQKLDEGDLAGAHRVAHTLRGSAAQIGAPAVEHHAGLVEDAARAGAATDSIAALLPPLDRALSTLLELLKKRAE